MDLGLAPDDRIVVLGSSGWFGREFHALVEASSANLLSVPGPSQGESVTETQIAEFDPTVVLNFAFLTREQVEARGAEEFERINAQLTGRFLRLASGDSVRTALTVSSGAAVTEPDHLYGRMKAEEEVRALDLVTDQRRVVVLRAYAVSGGYVRRPREYAFSDMIMRAADGAVTVKADRPVYRRYCSVSDALAIALRTGASGVFETGGDLVEMEELAEAVVEVVNPRATISRAPRVSELASSYHSDDSSWQAWSSQAGVKPMNLREQISAAASVLLG